MRAESNTKQPKRKRRTLRILLILILILLISIAAAAAYSYKSTKESLDISFTDKTPVVEAGGEYAAMSYVKGSVGDVEPSEEYLDADEPGEKELVYTVSEPVLGGITTVSEDYSLTYEVVDTV